MKFKKTILTFLITSLLSLLFTVNVQAADIYGNKSFIKPAGERKKAPKRKTQVKKKLENKADIKYVDKSESSKVRLYDPKTGKRIYNEEKKVVVSKTIGGKKFKSLGCVMCHKIDTGRLGPSLPKLAKTYAGKKDELMKYLHRDKDAQPLINSDRAAVMRSQLAKLRILSAEQLDEVARHILRAGKDE